MSNKYGIKRKDANSTRTGMKYKTNVNQVGKTVKENKVQTAFWKVHKTEELMTLSPEELDSVIEKMLLDYQARQLKQNPNWWWPELNKKTLSQARRKRLDNNLE